MAEAKKKLRLAAVSDIHYHRQSKGMLASLFDEISASADVLLLCGDLTDFGLREEAEVLAEDILTHVKIPTLGVLGNHDFESGQPEVVYEVMEEAGVVMLDGSCTEIEGVGFAGICGFCGGFGRWMLNAWGEPLIKEFVQATLNESLKLEQALDRLQTSHRIVLMHYAPIRATVVGESEEIFPFLGSSRFEEPLNRFGVTAVFHGHAHKGSPEGQTSEKIPVYNVSIPVLRASYPDQSTFRLFEVKLTEPKRRKAEAV